MVKMQDEDAPLVSIVCAVYNHEPYIRQCLEGFVTQKTNFKFEAVVHDDASTDKSADIIREYEAKYPEIIKPIYQKTNGYGSGRNARMKQKAWRGKYMAFCEGDDYWIDHYKLQKQVSFLEKNQEYGMVHTGYKILRNNQIIKTTILNPMPVGDIYNDLLEKSFIGTLTVVLRKSIHDKILPDIKPENSKHLVRDRLTWLAISRISKVHYINDITAVYRRHDASVSANLTPDKAKYFWESSYNSRFYFINKYDCTPKTKDQVYIDYYKGLLDFNYQLGKYKNSKKNYLLLKKLVHPNFSDTIKLIGSLNAFWKMISKFVLWFSAIIKKVIKKIKKLIN